MAALFVLAATFGVGKWVVWPAIMNAFSSTDAPDTGSGDRVFDHPRFTECWTDPRFQNHYYCYDEGGGTWDVTEICDEYPDTDVCPVP